MARRTAGKADDDAALMPAWKATYDSLSKLGEDSDMKETVTRVNKHMDQFKKESATKTASDIRPLRSEIKADMNKIKTSSEKEIENCNKALEQLAKLISLRAAAEVAVPVLADKRPKRGRDSSVTATATAQTQAQLPAGPTPSHPTAASTAASNLTLVLPPKGSLKVRIQSQLPLHPGRKVAFRLPSASDKTGKLSTPTGEGNGYEEGAWILAVVKGGEKNGSGKYVVEDVEGEDGQKPPTYTTTIKSLLPLPIASDPVDSPSHLNAYPEYTRGTIVLALFPDTTSFYKATVVASPKELQAAGSRTAPVATKAPPSYKVRFEDDQGQERLISAEEVIDFPGY